MSVYESTDFDRHEQVSFFHDADSGLQAIIAIHNTNLGPALGGVRMWPYASDLEALRDVLRLSRGMTYKAAMAGLELGGGKAVIVGDPRTDKCEALMRAMGQCIDSFGGRYIGAEDSGTSVADIKWMAKETKHVVGIADKEGRDGALRSGDPSPVTARGVFVGIRAAVRHAHSRDDLDGVSVAVQGVGNVGRHLVGMLIEAGARVWVTDLYAEHARAVADETGATPVDTDAIFDLDVDVFAPCAMGGVINEATLERLKARIVAGAANNQLHSDREGEALLQRGILYAPDYVINAGGLIDVAHERIGYDPAKVRACVDGIGDTLGEIFERASREQRATSVVADTLARERFDKPLREAA